MFFGWMGGWVYPRFWTCTDNLIFNHEVVSDWNIATFIQKYHKRQGYSPSQNETNEVGRHVRKPFHLSNAQLAIN